MQKFERVFDQLLQTLITALKSQFPSLGSIPKTTHYFKDILQELTQSQLVSLRALNQLRKVQRYVTQPSQINQETIVFMQQLLAYYQLEAAESNRQSITHSRLAHLFGQLDISSPQAVVNGKADLTDLQKYLNVPVPATAILNRIVNQLPANSHTLTLIIGRSGTGKSQLLSNLQAYHPELFTLPNLYIKDGAGISFDPLTSLDDQLLRDFDGFSDQQLRSNQPLHQIMTIPDVLLKHFARHAQRLGTFTQMIDMIQTTNILDGPPHDLITAQFQFVYIDRLPLYDVTPSGTQSDFLDQLTAKIFSANAYENPFYRAYQADVDQNIISPLHRNFQLLTHPQILTSIKYTLIKSQLENQKVFSIRELLTFFHDIVVPKPDTAKLDNTIFNLMFPEQPQTRILTDLHQCDPVTFQHPKITQLLLQFQETNDKVAFLQAQLNHYHLPSHWFTNSYHFLIDQNTPDIALARWLLRVLYLFDHQNEFFADPVYFRFLKSYTHALNYHYDANLAKLVAVGLQRWYSQTQSDQSAAQVHQLAIPLQLKVYYLTTERRLIKVFCVIFDEFGEHLAQIPISLSLFRLFIKLDQNYVLSPSDRQHHLAFSSFLTDLFTNLNFNYDTRID
ncbi:DNA phosphorothioation-dependent restriction protein DptF [Lactobacillus sp. CC-MHH1034]|uniref:DNA phosphorothioation-dependent restriction protein DptF n=1 Tax=Agrilactobacillus fermenti TaxID=2586909 RepID=UPI001E2EDC5F|nr:DNA phosphorothioation-dependent restriction protein DptF [Agrilactobacillus fermenti]MCD2256131.1 DNA phosphorothioation-dependent restriction protein DptF [Agrilactobacillus fermenti]